MPHDSASGREHLKCFGGVIDDVTVPMGSINVDEVHARAERLRVKFKAVAEDLVDAHSFLGLPETFSNDVWVHLLVPRIKADGSTAAMRVEIECPDFCCGGRVQNHCPRSGTREGAKLEDPARREVADNPTDGNQVPSGGFTEDKVADGHRYGNLSAKVNHFV